MTQTPTLAQLRAFVRAANYLSAAQIYLQDNFFLQEPLRAEHIKPRLLGHWGTVPGITFTYAFMNYMSIKYNASMLFVLGPGHGFPAVQSTLFIEKTLSKYFKEVPYSAKGIAYMLRYFSWPKGFPSHTNPGTPGAILEGGELGYSLSTAYGAVLDNPNLIVSCLVGDGEAETGPAAASWLANRFINPKKDGVVLPILHCNGYKISGPTVFGRMSNEELTTYFQGHGYEPLIVEGDDPYAAMRKACDHAYKRISKIKEQAHKGTLKGNPVWPMIVLRTPKGWTSIDMLDGQKIEGNALSHQVIAKDAKTNPKHLTALETWLHSYKFEELFIKDSFHADVLACVPKKPMGQNPHAFTEKTRKQLKLPSIAEISKEITKHNRGQEHLSSMVTAGHYLRDLSRANKNNFRLFSPDETYSNKLDAIFETTSRAWQWPIMDFDKDLSPDGRVVEILSEHTLQGMLQGYLLTGRHGIITSYEAFMHIVSSMLDQYAKFLKASRDYAWRKDVSSMNIILSSLGWRQDHNGYSHQNPSLISNMLEKHGDFVSVYFPVDANAMLVTLEDCFQRTNGINIIVAGKNMLPQWMSVAEARKQQKTGLSQWDFASHSNPDIVFAATGDYLTVENLAAIDFLRKELPELRTRFVNVSELTTLGIGDERRPVTTKTFQKYFTEHAPIVFSFHGYPGTIKQMLFGHGDAHRFVIRGYEEEGSTTSPFDMMVRNRCSRYDLIIAALEQALAYGDARLPQGKMSALIADMKKRLKQHNAYIWKHGDDPEEIKNWKWGYYQDAQA